MSDEYADESAEAKAPALDVKALAGAVARRWKLIACLTLAGLAAAHTAAGYVRPLYKSTAELLVYDPQRQIDSAIQKPISAFVSAIGYDAINTEVSIIKSKSVALRVASKLHLDQDPEFQPRSRLETVLNMLRLSHLARTPGDEGEGTSASQADRLDQAADVLMGRIEAWPNSYIISIAVSSREPAKAQLLAQTIADDYLSGQREARQEALQRVATWLQDRVKGLRNHMLETEADIEKLKADNGIRDTELSVVRDQQIGLVTSQLMAAREDLSQKRARLDQTRQLIDSNGDILSIPELAASQTLAVLRQKQAILRSRLEILQRAWGEGHVQVVAAKADLAAITAQKNTEASLVLATMQNGFDIALRQEQALQANLESLVAPAAPRISRQLQQLRRIVDTDRSLYESYLSQYNDISERRTLQDASARIISTAALPRSPSSTRGKLIHGLGGAAGLGGGILFALLLEISRVGLKTTKEVEGLFGHPVVGVIPLASRETPRYVPRSPWAGRPAYDLFAYAAEAVRAMRITLELCSARPQVILITSSLPSEGKTTTARLLAASSAIAGRQTLLIDCDLHQQPTGGSGAEGYKPGLSDLFNRTAELADVLVKDPIANYHVIPGGSNVSNAADWLMSTKMRDLVNELRGEFDYIVMDTPPLLPVVDALALSPLADKILVVVAWRHTPRRRITEALKILQPELHRVAGIVLNKVDFAHLPEHAYGSERYGYPCLAAAKSPPQTVG
jgi:polysaccharide biosynthesis transport protein